MIVVCFNPGGFASRWANTRALQARLGATEGVEVFTAELAYGEQAFRVTAAGDARHLQLRLRGDDAEPPLWHKLNLVNLAVARLLPPTWRAFAYVDAEVSFGNPRWAVEALHALTRGGVDVLQPFSTVFTLGSSMASLAAVALLPSLAHLRPHAGYAWALSRLAYTRMGGLFDLTISGGDDSVIGLACADNPVGRAYFNGTWGEFGSRSFSRDWYAAIAAFARRARGLRLGVVAGELSHTEHGRLRDKQYFDKIVLMEHFEPSLHVTRNADGLLVPTPAMPRNILDGIRGVLMGRAEDAPVEDRNALHALHVELGHAYRAYFASHAAQTVGGG